MDTEPYPVVAGLIDTEGGHMVVSVVSAYVVTWGILLLLATEGQVIHNASQTKRDLP